MPTLLNQLLGVEGRARAKAESTRAQATDDINKSGPLNGLARKYAPKVDGEQGYPQESTQVQLTVKGITDRLAADLGRWWDITASRDRTNTEAKANIVVEGDVLLADVPASYLVWFEKQLIELRGFLVHLPILDPAEIWNTDETTGVSRSEPEERQKTHEVFKNHRISPATKEHPEKVHVYTVSEPEGTWTVTKLSGAIDGSRRQQLLDRIDVLIDAVTFAREEANRTPVTDLKVGSPVFEYLLAP